ncbi:MAG TPA: alpha/beta fold hydrolase [Rhodothermales bacterium]|mgnify:FL=1|nr:alpha/beta fold hydrolase [Rhodothermales bacterium]
MRIKLLKSFILCGLAFGIIFAQPRGKALYQAMTSGSPTTMSGSSFMRWHPTEAATLVFESGQQGKTETAQWYKVDPVTKVKTLLFDETHRTTIIRQYNDITGLGVQNLPFSQQMQFNDAGTSIFFKVEKRPFVYDLKNRKLRELKHPEVKQQPGTDGLMRNMPGSQLWNGEYSPDYNWFAYVVDYDLFVADTRNGKTYRITNDGSENIFNGRPNWVYPEEFDQLTAYWWSPDSKRLAFYRSDESAVWKYPLVRDNRPEAELELQSYPKAGEPNPTVKLFIAEIPTGKKVELATNSTADNYLVRPTWTLDSKELTFQRVNRQQNVVELLAADAKKGTLRTILTEQEPQFVNLQDDYFQLKEGKSFLWSSERSGYRQLYTYDWQGNVLKSLTNGTKPVQNVVRVDEKNGYVYYMVNDNMGMETIFMRTKLDGTGVAQALTTVPGSHNISMDQTATYYLDTFSNFTTPTISNLHKADGTLIENRATAKTDKVDGWKLEKPELVIVKAADKTTDLPGILYRPAGYNPAKKYPLLVSVYGGPHSKAIRNNYNMASNLQALAQLGYIVWHVDNRGLVGRGKAFETATYRKLGLVDLDDQTAAIKQVCAQFSFVDCSRVGIYGHSYGGYMSALALLREPEVYHVGVAGAPVTDWRNYDTIYTERYMFTPQDNKSGYDEGATMTYAKNLKGKLLLVHGTIDNNVHPGNTMQLIEALVKEGKKFDLMMYPLNRHGIGGPSGKHYNTLRLDYFEQHLKPEPVE